MDSPSEVYDLLILVDATYSMSDYLDSLQTSLPQIISISTLTDCFSRIGLLAYRDYCDQHLLEWSGWIPGDGNVIGLAKKLYPMGGGDGPEATKTGLARAYELMREDATTIILLYTDAPPHTFANGSMTDLSSNLGAEQKALTKESYGGFGHNFADWVSASKYLSKRRGDKKSQVFSILEGHMHVDNAGYYNYLSTMTGGACFYLADSKPASISKVTVEVLLAWMGAEKVGAASTDELPAYLTRYVSIENMKTLKTEQDPDAAPFFRESSGSSKSRATGESNIAKVRASADTFKKYLPKKATPVQDFAKRYAADEKYKKVAVEYIKKIIEDDVVAISLNPVFGSLWRAVCNDRENPARDEVITAFGLQVDRIANADEKARMKTWLEESYDYTAEVMETIESVPHVQRFPCVCLDPTLIFTHETEDSDEDETNKPITSFRRDELLEIGRSCDYRILRRLGRVLTRLTYINSAEEMPAHIAAAPETETPRIPMALASPKHKRKFWRILLHIVVPGTMLSARPAALLAALSIRLGLEPLLEAADREMLLWRDRWNDLEIPETWNTSCLGLLLDADEAYRKRKDAENTDVSTNLHGDDGRAKKRICPSTGLLTTPSKAKDTSEKATTKSLLKAQDRALFERLVSYKMLELNLDTTLTARIGWTPEKTSVAIGPTVICRSCEYPRSVTIMGASGKCGHCLWTEYISPDDRQEHITARVTKEDDETTPATWVECNVRTCRAQYVVYRPENLNVRPKCHYCRESGTAPTLECTDCLNQVIWPVAYRPKNMGDFKCYACTTGRKTIVDVEATATKISKENSTDWLLRNDKKIAEPFNKRSLFHTISTAGTEDFIKKVELLPAAAQHNLRLDGKLIRNAPDLVAQLQSWVTRRRTESGTCSLCFSSIRKSDLRPACGRSGCHQRICKGCLDNWYGLNVPGQIINNAALSCPFCRRAPRAKTLSRYGMGIHAVGDLKTAVEESGEWIFAWCKDCGRAKQFMERVCAAGAPPEIKGWKCEICREWKGDVSMKKCPGCGTMTEKVSGCDHITCTVNGCGTHWCFFCGGKFDQDTIYPHMNEHHGGYYGGGGAEGYETDEDY